MWNVLIVEDDLKGRQQLMRALEKKAHYSGVATGEEALHAYRKSIQTENHFDFILLDVTIPGLNGFEVLKAIRAEEQKVPPGSRMPVFIIMITAYKDSLMEHYDMGWDDFITKPFEAEKLIQHMQTLKNKPRNAAAKGHS
jgi:DNA-binding response OmpR family regulator